MIIIRNFQIIYYSKTGRFKDMLSNTEWELINKILLIIYSEDNSYSMRKAFLKNLRSLIPFDTAEFSLINEELKLYNSAEVNMVNNEIINIAEKYNKCKEMYGIESTDYIFRYPESYIACNKTTILRKGYYEKSKFSMLFLKSINMKYCCTLTIKSNEIILAELSLYYSADPDFSEKDIYIISQFKDHLTNRLTQLHIQNMTHKLSKLQLDFLLKNKLTEREIQIAELIFSDMPNYNITKSLCISNNTLKKHISNIYKKLEISSRIQLRHVLSENNL